MKRREFVSTVSAVAGGLALAGRPLDAKAPSGAVQARRRARMVAGCQRSPTTAAMLMHFKRHGVNHICGYPPEEDRPASWTVDALSRLRDLCSSHGVSLDMVQFPFMSSSHVDRGDRKAIMLGQDPERQKEIDEAIAIIRNCAAAGIPAVKYNLSLLGVLRTRPTPGRGGTSYSTWRLADAPKDEPLTRAGRVPAEAMWERIARPYEGVARGYRFGPADAPEGYIVYSHQAGQHLHFAVVIRDLVLATPGAARTRPSPRRQISDRAPLALPPPHPSSAWRRSPPATRRRS